MNIFYRYGMAKEKTLFQNSKNLFSGIVIPIHIALDQIDSLPEWLAINKINYFVDPIAYIFTEKTAKLYNKDGKLRRSYGKYIDALGLENIDFVNDTIDLGYFESEGSLDNKIISDFVEANLRTQIDIKELDEERDKETKEFIEFFKNEGIDYPLGIALESGHNPLFYTSPGFFFNSTEDGWFKLNIQLMEETIKQSGDQKAFGYLPISSSLLGKDISSKIVKEIPSALDGIVVWFEDFDDVNATEEELRFVASTINGLTEKGLAVINLYGGLFSALLCSIECYGYSSGLCYDTHKSRDIEPEGGPIPLRYYVPEVFRFMRQSDAEAFYHLVDPACDCDICKTKKETMKNDEGFLKVDMFVESFFDFNKSKERDYLEHEEALKNHFIYCTKNQIDKIEKDGSMSFINEKKVIYERLVKNFGQHIANSYASHIPRWIKILSEFQ